jgi:predicted nucleic acid-binding protein
VTSIVIDASVALSWCFEDEASEATDQLLRQLADMVTVVPAHWHLEVANVLALAERRRRITLADSAEFIDLLETLDIEHDDETSERAFGRVLDLARGENLTAYDAAYLELAMRLGIPLATKDGALQAAARRVGVEVVSAD